MPAPDRPSKQDAFLALLREGWTSLHLDARRPGVIVPAHLRGEAHLVLQYGHDLPISIPDLEVDDYGVRATLSFSRNPQLTVVPWSAVYVVACDDGRGVLYQEDVPEDVSIVASRPPTDRAPTSESDIAGIAGIAHENEEAFDVQGRAAAAASAAAAKRRDSADRLLKAVPDDAVLDLDDSVDAPPRRRRPQLRLVK
jgi:stringent starvation protein B